MAKRYEDPIEVATDETGFESAPVSFRWRGRHYYVDDRLSSWREAGEWWHSNGNGSKGTREREYFRVLAHPAGMGATGDLDADGFFVSCSSVYDIYRDRINGRWRLARVWD